MTMIPMNLNLLKLLKKIMTMKMTQRLLNLRSLTYLSMKLRLMMVILMTVAILKHLTMLLFRLLTILSATVIQLQPIQRQAKI